MENHLDTFNYDDENELIVQTVIINLRIFTTKLDKGFRNHGTPKEIGKLTETLFCGQVSAASLFVFNRQKVRSRPQDASQHHIKLKHTLRELHTVSSVCHNENTSYRLHIKKYKGSYWKEETIYKPQEQKKKKKNLENMIKKPGYFLHCCSTVPYRSPVPEWQVII